MGNMNINYEIQIRRSVMLISLIFTSLSSSHIHQIKWDFEFLLFSLHKLPIFSFRSLVKLFDDDERRTEQQQETIFMKMKPSFSSFQDT